MSTRHQGSAAGWRKTSARVGPWECMLLPHRPLNQCNPGSQTETLAYWTLPSFIPSIQSICKTCELRLHSTREQGSLLSPPHLSHHHFPSRPIPARPSLLIPRFHSCLYSPPSKQQPEGFYQKVHQVMSLPEQSFHHTQSEIQPP